MFTAIVTSHNNDAGLRHLLGNLMYQTRPPDEIIVLVSDPQDLARLREDFPEVQFCEQENKNDWGHDKRSVGLGMALGDWVGFFNDDDSYHDQYLEKMIRDDADIVYCDWNIPNCGFFPGSSTSGNFVIRTELARKVGWRWRHYEADGQFILFTSRQTSRIEKVKERLYSHNIQPFGSRKR